MDDQALVKEDLDRMAAAGCSLPGHDHEAGGCAAMLRSACHGRRPAVAYRQGAAVLLLVCPVCGRTTPVAVADAEAHRMARCRDLDLGPTHRDGPDIPDGHEEVRLAVDVEGGLVRVLMGCVVDQLQLTPAHAREMARRLEEAAGEAENGGGHG